jgi:hypothetical protein
MATELMGGVCCKCGAVRIVGDTWVKLPGVQGVPYELSVRTPEGLALYKVSHGYCPTCANDHLIAIMERGRANRGEEKG